MTPRYSTDLTDAQMGPCRSVLSCRLSRGRTQRTPPQVSLPRDSQRHFLSAPCRVRVGTLTPRISPARDVLSLFSPSENGLLEKLHASLRETIRLSQKRDTTPAAAIIDSQSVKTTEKGGSRGRTRLATTATKRSKDASVTCSSTQTGLSSLSS